MQRERRFGGNVLRDLGRGFRKPCRFESLANHRRGHVTCAVSLEALRESIRISTSSSGNVVRIETDGQKSATGPEHAPRFKHERAGVIEYGASH